MNDRLGSPQRRHVPNKLRGVTTGAVGSGDDSSPSKSRLKGRKSRPWRADAASWKQQMKERKAVFQNFAVNEEEDPNAVGGGGGDGDGELQDEAGVNGSLTSTPAVAAGEQQHNKEGETDKVRDEKKDEDHTHDHQKQQQQAHYQEKAGGTKTTVERLMRWTTKTSPSKEASKDRSDNDDTVDDLERARRREEEVEQYIRRMKQKQEDMMKQSPRTTRVAPNLQQNRQSEQEEYVTPLEAIQKSILQHYNDDDEIMAARSPMAAQPPSPEDEGDIPMVSKQPKQPQHPPSAAATGAATVDENTSTTTTTTTEMSGIDLPKDSPLNGGDMLMSALFGRLPKFQKTVAEDATSDEASSSTQNTENDVIVNGNLRQREAMGDIDHQSSNNNDVSKSLSDDDHHRAASACCCPLDSIADRSVDEKDIKDETSCHTASTDGDNNAMTSSANARLDVRSSSQRPNLTVDTAVIEHQELDRQLDTPHPVRSEVKTTSEKSKTFEDNAIAATNTLGMDKSLPARVVDPDPLQRARKGFVLSDLQKSPKVLPKAGEEIIESEANSLVSDENDKKEASTDLLLDSVLSSVSEPPLSEPLKTSLETTDFDEVDDYNEVGLNDPSDETTKHSQAGNDHAVDELDDVEDYDGEGVKTGVVQELRLPRETSLADNMETQHDSEDESPIYPSMVTTIMSSNDLPTEKMLIDELTARLEKLHTGHHKFIEAPGRAGPDGPVKPPPKSLTPSERRTLESRGNVFNELSARASSLYTEHHHVAESPTSHVSKSTSDIKQDLTNEGADQQFVHRDEEQTLECSDQPMNTASPPSSFVAIGGQSWEEYIDPHATEEEKGLSQQSGNDAAQEIVAGISPAVVERVSGSDMNQGDSSERNVAPIFLEEETAPVSKPNKRRESTKGKKWKDRLASKKSAKGDKNKIVETVEAGILPPASQALDRPKPAALDNSLEPSSMETPVKLDSPVNRVGTSDAPSVESPEDTPSARNSAGKSNKWKARLAKMRNSTVAPPIPAISAIEDEHTLANAEVLKKSSPEPIDKGETETESTGKNATVVEPAMPEKQTEATKTTDEMQPFKVEAPKAPISSIGDGAVQSQDDTPRSDASNDGLRTSFNKFDQFLSAREALPIDDESVYTEITIGQDSLMPTSATTSANIVGHQLPNDEDEQSYMEYTIAESVQESYMEETVYSEYTMGQTVTQMNENAAGIQKISPFMSNLLSSRMFQDVTPAMPVQQETSHEYHDKRFPTINLHPAHDDDDMTQITMDHEFHSMDEDDEGDDGEAILRTPEPSSDSKAVKQPLITSNQAGRPPPVPTVEKSPTVLSVKSSSKSLKSSKSKHSNKSRKSLGDSSATSYLSSESSKQRMTDILRKEIWSRDLRVVRGALHELSTEAAKGYKYRSYIVRIGGIISVIKAMEMNGQDVAVQVSCSKILATLALEPENHALVCEMEGVPLIVRAMQDFPDSVELQAAACTSLATICRHQEMESSTDVMKGAEGAVLTLLISMTKNPDHRVVRAKAFSAICNLCIDNQDRLSELSEAGGIMTLTMAIQKPWDDMNEQQEAISSLSILLRGVAELNASSNNTPSAAAAANKEKVHTMVDNDGSNSSLETREDDGGEGDGISSKSDGPATPQNIVAVDSDLDCDAAELDSLPRFVETPKKNGSGATSRTSSDESETSHADVVEPKPSDDSDLEELINKASAHGGMEAVDIQSGLPSSSDDVGTTTDPSLLKTQGGSWTPTDFVNHSQVDDDGD
eukprot:CAMPEP_0113505256 /NCGR_PEP_ID=MMETSP0014_2-20120614/35206_1 /TAXON_ID=2857 /ORGANISM="Nitzschia sp." /LENGTH=1751 /DNA_ID=CAMNT_0000400529 /DNA_START=346 /DNA_END=5598 /DNA_ORIENTATION=+ /assembly_acc=CAM_ASM_000159